MTTILHIRLLGEFRLNYSDTLLTTINTSRLQSLLAYLVLHRHALQPRAHLAFLLWPDSTEAQARTNLRQQFHLLRQALPEADRFLQADAKTLQWRSDAPFSLDIDDFENATAPDASLMTLQEAVDLYHGDLLPGCYEEWILPERERLRQRFVAALERLIGLLEKEHDYAAAIRYAQRLVKWDPLHELAHCRLMDLYIRAGDRAAALRQYQTCVRVFKKELGVSPSVTTTALFERIRQGVGAETQEGAIPLTPIQLPSFLKQTTSPLETTSVFVARERELAELEETLDTARAGQGQILFVIGGAGRGKTMLLQEFARRAQATDPELLVFSGYCNAHTGTGDPYLPFREALTLLAGEVEAKWAGGLISLAHARRLWEVMPLTLPALVEHAPDLIDSFVSGKALQERAATFAPPEAAWFSRLTSMVADGQRVSLEQKRILAQYTALLKAIAGQRPLLLIIEDLHWVDTSSSDLLFHLSRTVSDSRILMVGAYRPEEVPLSQPRSGAEHGARHPLASIVSELKRRHGDIWLDLRDMTPLEGRHFVEAYLDTQPNRLGPAFREELFRHTGGHALFTVELLREMVDRGDLRQDEAGLWVTGEIINWHRLPARVEGVIERRINRLEEVLQAVLTIASVEGESFTAEVVAQVQQLNERGLVQRLSQELDKQHRLVTAQALERLAKQRLSIYRFRHHLFQHYLYHRLDETERTYLHEEVGTVLEVLYGEQTEKVALQLARHFEIAGLTDKAVEYLRQAGEWARRLSAYEEAIVHFSQALTLVKTLPPTPENKQQEITLQVAVGVLLQATKGLASPEAEQAFSQARRLCQQVEETPQLFPVLWGLWLFYVVRAEYRTALELAQQLSAMSKQRKDQTSVLAVHRALGTTLFWLGNLILAREHLEQVITHYQPEQHHAMSSSYGGSDIKVHCLCYGSLAIGELGYLDQALKMSQESLTLAQELSHPYSLAAASLFAAWLHSTRREGRAAQARAEETIRLSTEYGFQFWLTSGIMLRGWALAEQGHVDEGIVQIRQGLSDWRAIGAEGWRPYFLTLLAETYGKAGQIEEGLSVLVEALATVEKTEERFWEAESYRIKGELLRQAGAKAEEEIEQCFRRAIEIARSQSARSLELRAVMGLSRLWQRQGKKDEACQMLMEIYGWFTEGFDTVDLQEAKALLEELREEGSPIADH